MINPADLFVFNFFTVSLFAYLLGVALTATYFYEHPPTDCGVCNNLFALAWPGTLFLKLFNRLLDTDSTD